MAKPRPVTDFDLDETSMVTIQPAMYKLLTRVQTKDIEPLAEYLMQETKVAFHHCQDIVSYYQQWQEENNG